MELGRLTAVFDADYRKFDAGVNHVKGKIGGVTKDLGSATSSTNQLTNAIGPASTGLTGMAGTLGMASGAAIVAATAISAVIAGFLSLVKHSADVAGNLKDMSDQTNYAVETLSTLQVAGKRAGVDLSGLSASLIIFQKNQGAAASGNDGLAKTFKDLNIDLRDNEKGLRQAFTALYQMGEGQRQTEVGAKLFGRGIKQVQGILKETNGDIDKAMERYSRLGLIISTETALAADDFSDTLQTVQDQIDATSRAIVSKSLPSFTVFFDDISRMLGVSANEWMYWADVVKGSVAGVLGGVQGLAEYIASRGTLTLSIAIESSIRSNLQRAAQEEALNLMEATTGRASRMAGADRIGGGGGGKGGGGARKDVVQGLKDALNGLNAEYRKYNIALFDSTNYTALATEKEKLLSSVMSSLNATTKARVAALRDVDHALEAAIGALPKKSQSAAKALLEQALAQFKSNEQLRIDGELNKQADELMKQWKRDIDNTITGADQYTIAIQELEDAYRKYGETLSSVDRQELNQLANMQRMIALGRKAAESARQLFAHDVSGPAGELFPANIGELNENLSRAIEARMGGLMAPPDLGPLREQMEELARDITGIFDRALYDGISGGAKRGLQSLALGFLDLIQQIILGQLKNAIADALTTGASGGGGWLAKALSFLVGAAAGGIGGGATGAGSSALGALTRASGGPVSANTPYIVGETGRELFMPDTPGRIIPNNKLGGNTVNHIHVTFQQKGMQTFRQKRSQREVAERVAGLLAT